MSVSYQYKHKMHPASSRGNLVVKDFFSNRIIIQSYPFWSRILKFRSSLYILRNVDLGLFKNHPPPRNGDFIQSLKTLFESDSSKFNYVAAAIFQFLLNYTANVCRDLQGLCGGFLQYLQGKYLQIFPAIPAICMDCRENL